MTTEAAITLAATKKNPAEAGFCLSAQTEGWEVTEGNLSVSLCSFTAPIPMGGGEGMM